MNAKTPNYEFLHIASGEFASVYAAYQISTPTKFAIKIFAEVSMKEVILNEIHLMEIMRRKVDFHPNIIRFYGITKFRNEINFALILEYADGGTLGEYLRNNAISFKWERQLEFANDIASAILWLHDNGIIHRNLLAILNGIREIPISTTNSVFVELYQRCWEHEPDERPDIDQVISELSSIDPKIHFISKVNDKNEIKDDVDFSSCEWRRPSDESPKLEKMVIEKWKSVLKEIYRNLINSMPSLIYAVISAKEDRSVFPQRSTNFM
ncbi:5525_t:CDS:2 [Funneliformis caledonium]|uniref:5525_t:CDS:1 n=1 Tax=Funneliformis caledonium TaxID=1117310 RepID=A0A9N9CJJ4_9GLOM|nr:5525_t:CDS:2 [Funneliformis caledonium]